MPGKDPTWLLISCLCLAWWIGPVLTANKRCIYVNEREHACSPMLERIVFSTKYNSWKPDRQVSRLFWNIGASWHEKQCKILLSCFLGIFFCTKNANSLLKQFSCGDKDVFSGSAGKHSAWRKSWIPKGFSAVGFFPSNISAHLMKETFPLKNLTSLTPWNIHTTSTTAYIRHLLMVYWQQVGSNIHHLQICENCTCVLQIPENIQACVPPAKGNYELVTIPSCNIPITVVLPFSVTTGTLTVNSRTMELCQHAGGFQSAYRYESSWSVMEH